MNFVILGGALMVFVVLTLFLRRRRLKAKLAQLRSDWGKVPSTAVDVDSARLLFELGIPESCRHSYCVDEDTWMDLDLDDIFTQINRTTTAAGAQSLFYLLRHPVVKEEILLDREVLVDRFSSDQSLRERIQLAIQGLSETNAKYLPFLLWRPLPEKPFYAKFLPILSLLSVFFLLLVLFDFLHFGALIAVFFINLVVRYFVKKRIDPFIYSIKYLGSLIAAAKKLSSITLDGMRDIQSSLKDNLKQTRDIERKIFTLQFEDSVGLNEYLNTYFLWDITGFYSAASDIKQHTEELRSLYRTVGYLDALISIASFRLEYDQSCRPLLDGNSEEYTISDIYNPLLRDPVPNNFAFDRRDCLVTGSNMAGKTTFIKTMGVNAILAQTINTCLATEYKAPFLKVISSIGREDNILLGKSYYMVEIESILRLIKASESEAVHLLILDEIYRGTNSVERHAASIAVLSHLANKKDFVLVATHDLELSEIMGHEYQNIHFREDINNEGLTFDYILRPGSSTSRNAIALLQHVGYPKSIIENAVSHIDDNDQ